VSAQASPFADDVMPGTRILLADDHVLVREGFRSLLERAGFHVVAEASDGYEAVRLAAELKPDIAVLDLSMPLFNGLEASREILAATPSTRTVILTMHFDKYYTIAARKAGASAYILKSTGGRDLVGALCEVSQGRTYAPPETAAMAVQVQENASRVASSGITLRERQVLQLIAEGKTGRQTASLLGISAKTAAIHRARLMKKLGVHNTAGLVRYAISTGVVAA
jgi:two-component system, NarL family, response regulator NreC